MSTRSSRRPTITNSRQQAGSNMGSSRMSINPSNSRRTVITLSDQKMQKQSQNKPTKVRDQITVTDDMNSVVTPARLFAGQHNNNNSSPIKKSDQMKGGKNGLKNQSRAGQFQSTVNNNNATQTVGQSMQTSSIAVTDKRSSIMTAYASELFNTLRSTQVGNHLEQRQSTDFMSLASTLYQGGITSTTKLGNKDQGASISSSQAGFSTTNIFASIDRKDSVASSQSNQSIVMEKLDQKRSDLSGVLSPKQIDSNVSNNTFNSTSDRGATIDSRMSIIQSSSQGENSSKSLKSKDKTKKELNDQDLTQEVDVNIEESEVFVLLDIKGGLISLEDETFVHSVATDNEKYEALCASKEGNDKYAERSMQTSNNAAKSRHVQCEPIKLISVGNTANTADIYDENLAKKKKELLEQSNLEGLNMETQEDIDAVLEDFIDDDTKKQAENGGKNGTTRLGVTTDTEADPFASNTSSVALLSTVQGSFVRFDHPKSTDDQKKIVAERIKSLQVEGILKSVSFNENLSLIERMLSLNLNQDALAQYQQLFAKRIATASSRTNKSENDTSLLDSESIRSKPRSTNTSHKSNKWEVDLGAKKLFTYFNPEIFEELGIPRTVTTITLNKKNPNLIAVGYGYFTAIDDHKINKFDTKSKHAAGVVCCWNIKNLGYPERIYVVPSGVTSLDFSQQNSNLLSVGCFDGSLYIYNVKSRSDKPIIDSSETMAGIDSQRSGPKNQHGNQRHTAAIWHSEWIERGVGASGDEKQEHLVSIAADGRVTQWSIRKGFENIDLMKLKRTTGKGTAGAAIQNASRAMKDAKNNKGQKDDGKVGLPRSQKTEAFIFRNSPGLSFAFHLVDANQYIVGTEEGKIHRCSCSYNEQYLETYHGHTGIINKVVWSPFNTDVFLSASSDWTAKVWLTSDMEMNAADEHFDAAVTMNHGSGNSVIDCAWHPKVSTVFITLTNTDLRVFDLTQSCLDPVKIVKITNDFPQKNQSIIYPRLTKCVFIPNDPYMSVHVGDENGNVSVFELSDFPEVNVMNKNRNKSLEEIIKQARESMAK